jgi:predicted ATP-grasp superfamily ATP-dependent carboligase
MQVWQPGALAAELVGEPCYFQERRTGKPISALCLAMRNGAVLIGVSEQLIGLPAVSAGPFAYCGSIGPLPLAESTYRQIAQTGEVVASAFGLRGLFGIDLVLDPRTGVACPTEVNPRYTASVEIYEWVTGLSLLKWHIRACQAYESDSASRRVAEEFQAELGAAGLEQPTDQAAKVIIYAPFLLRAPNLTVAARLHSFGNEGIEIADRPTPGIPIPAKAPFCTLIAKAAGPKGVAVFEKCLSVLADEFERNRLPE